MIPHPPDMIRFLLCIVWLTAGVVRAAELVPGKSVFGAHDYTEYIPGDLPVLLAAPHGGRLKPEEIPDRPQGVREADANTQELARAVAAVIHARTGRHAHLGVTLKGEKVPAAPEVQAAAQ
jgi:hypothetical protein